MLKGFSIYYAEGLEEDGSFQFRPVVCEIHHLYTSGQLGLEQKWITKLGFQTHAAYLVGISEITPHPGSNKRVDRQSRYCTE